MRKIVVRFGAVLLIVSVVSWGWLNRSATLPVQAEGYCDQPIFGDSGQLLGNEYSLDVALADLDGDNDVDAVISNGAGPFDEVWLNNGDGQFSHLPTFFGDPMDTPNVVLGDIDNDADVDIILGSAQPVLIYQNDGQAGFTQNQFIGGMHTAVSLHDLDNSNGPDLIVGGNNDSYAPQLYWNTGSPTNTFDPGFTFPISITVEILTGDFDGDTLPDLLFVNGGEQPAMLWHNNGDATFSLIDMVQEVWAINSAVAFDADDNGSLDVMAGTTSGHIVTWLNDGNGDLQESSGAIPTTGVMDLAVGDVDGDNDLDLFAAGTDSALLLNNGGGVFCITQSWTEVGDTAVSLADLDGDNDLDAITTRDGANRVWFNGDFSTSEPDLAITLEGFTHIQNGWETYTVTVRNLGSTMTANVIFDLDTDAEGDFLWQSIGHGNCSSSRLPCNLGQLLAGETVTLYFQQQFFIDPYTGYGDASLATSVTTDSDEVNLENNTAVLDINILDCTCSLTRYTCLRLPQGYQVATNAPQQTLTALDGGTPDLDLILLYRLRNEQLVNTVQGQYYTDLYYAHDADLWTVLMTAPSVWEEGMDTILTYSPV